MAAASAIWSRTPRSRLSRSSQRSWQVGGAGVAAEGLGPVALAGLAGAGEQPPTGMPAAASVVEARLQRGLADRETLAAQLVGEHPLDHLRAGRHALGVAVVDQAPEVGGANHVEVEVEGEPLPLGAAGPPT